MFEWRSARSCRARPPVELWFEASGEGTRVTLEHRGWSTIRDDHPVRHGKPVPEFIRDTGLWWGALLTSLREHAESKVTPRSDP